MTEPLVHLEAPLSPAEDPSEPIRRGHLKHRSVPYLEHEAPDHYAPVRFNPGCIDRTGYKRRRHDWDREGTCLFCSRHRLWDPL